MAQPPAVIDTNVVVSGLLTTEPHAPTRRILDAMRVGGFFYLLSQELLAEYRRVLLRPKIQTLHGLSEPEVDEILVEIAFHGGVRTPRPAPQDPPDPGDRILWDLLAAEPGAVLVTGDAQLLDHPPAFARVLTPAVFVRLWGLV